MLLSGLKSLMWYSSWKCCPIYVWLTSIGARGHGEKDKMTVVDLKPHGYLLPHRIYVLEVLFALFLLDRCVRSQMKPSDFLGLLWSKDRIEPQSSNSTLHHCRPRKGSNILYAYVFVCVTRITCALLKFTYVCAIAKLALRVGFLTEVQFYVAGLWGSLVLVTVSARRQ